MKDMALAAIIMGSSFGALSWTMLSMLRDSRRDLVSIGVCGLMTAFCALMTAGSLMAAAQHP